MSVAQGAAQGPAHLRVRGLRIETSSGVEIVDEIGFELARGKVFALVGESGCGKSSVALALLGYARPGTRITAGEVWLGEVDMLSLTGGSLRAVRGSRVSYVPQDPSKGLSPRRTILSQLVESLVVHGRDRAAATERAFELLRDVELPTAAGFVRRYPFELSGGQQQRVLIAMALACGPEVVVLDEPTTALDATSQARIIELVGRLAAQRSAAFVYVTHDLGIVQEIADRVGVMYSGRMVETGPCADFFTQPAHPYTALLLKSVPSVLTRRVLHGIPGTTAQPGHRPSGCFFRTRCPSQIERCGEEFPPITSAHTDGFVRCFRPQSVRLEVMTREEITPAAVTEPELEVRHLVAAYGHGPHRSVAVEDVSFSIGRNECLAIVGESGSGKSTTGRCVAGLHVPAGGEVLLAGQVLSARAQDREREQLRRLQIIFQNPDRSLNPSHTIRSLVGRPIRVFTGARPEEAQVRQLLERVRLSSRVLDRYPGELSGGEKQRVAIARALAAKPTVVVCDEITSALDVSIQAAIVDLLEELRKDGLTLLFITHNLGVVRALADRALVMRAGRTVEEGETRSVILNAQHPYTQELCRSVPEVIIGQTKPVSLPTQA